MFKKCSFCNQNLEASSFYKDMDKITGLSSLCKSCDKAKKVLVYRVKNNIDLINPVRRKRIRLNSLKKRSKKIGVYKAEVAARYAKTDKGRLARLKASERARAKFPEKWAARSKLRQAVAKGDIEKSPICFESGFGTCSESRLQAHHYLGYQGEHWRDVDWLCVPHHVQRHQQLRQSGITI